MIKKSEPKNLFDLKSMYSLILDPAFVEEIICEYDKLKCTKNIKNIKPAESFEIRLAIIFTDMKSLQALQPKSQIGKT
jgi:hypothetical protein